MSGGHTPITDHHLSKHIVGILLSWINEWLLMQFVGGR